MGWRAAIADAVVETHDRIVGKTWRDAKRLCDSRVDDAKVAVQQTLRSFTELGTALLAAHSDGASLETTVSDTPGWSVLEELVATSAQLTNTMAADPLAHIVQGHRRFRRYAPRMLKALDIKAAPVAIPLVNATESIGGKVDRAKPTDFLRKNSKWHRNLKAQPEDDHRLWEVAVLFHLRDAFRSGDIWLGHSKRYADLKQVLVPISAVTTIPRLTMPQARWKKMKAKGEGYEAKDYLARMLNDGIGVKSPAERRKTAQAREGAAKRKAAREAKAEAEAEKQALEERYRKHRHARTQALLAGRSAAETAELLAGIDECLSNRFSRRHRKRWEEIGRAPTRVGELDRAAFGLIGTTLADMVLSRWGDPADTELEAFKAQELAAA